MESLSKREVNFDASGAFELLDPPSRFSGTNFENYFPNPNFPSQATAKRRCLDFAQSVTKSERVSHPGIAKFFPGRSTSVQPGRGIYLDGGFGVGKTHLLGSIYRAVDLPKAYCSFVGMVNLVGAVGFEKSVASLAELALVAVDEFELDDPGETVLVSSLLSRLADNGVNLAATSNTLPEKLGEGRFAAVDFLREIQGLGSKFEVVTIAGPDFRQRELHLGGQEVKLQAVLLAVDASQLTVSCDALHELGQVLASIHPAMYSKLLESIDLVVIASAHCLESLAEALRFVVFVDRAYELGIPILVADFPFSSLYPEEFYSSGFRKKFGRSLSRLSQLNDEGISKLGIS